MFALREVKCLPTNSDGSESSKRIREELERRLLTNSSKEFDAQKVLSRLADDHDAIKQLRRTCFLGSR